MIFRAKKVKTLHNIEKKALNKREAVQVKRSFIPFGISVREEKSLIKLFFPCKLEGEKKIKLTSSQARLWSFCPSVNASKPCRSTFPLVTICWKAGGAGCRAVWVTQAPSLSLCFQISEALIFMSFSHYKPWLGISFWMLKTVHLQTALLLISWATVLSEPALVHSQCPAKERISSETPYRDWKQKHFSL